MGTSIPANTKVQYGPLVTSRTATGYRWSNQSSSYVPDGSTDLSSRTEREASSTYVAKSSNTTPNYHKLVKAGGFLPCNGFFNTSVKETFPMGYYESEQYMYDICVDKSLITGCFGYMSKMYIGALPGPTSDQLSRLDAEARTKIRLNLKQQTVNIAQIIAERDKAAASISKIVQTITRMILALKAGNLKKAGEELGKHVGWRKASRHGQQHRADPGNAFANAWLELQYAITPLMLDAVGIAESLAKYEYRPVRGRVSATCRITGNNVSTTGTLSSGLILSQSDWVVSKRYVVLYQIDSPKMPDFAGLGLTNPAMLAWELIPFSFVIDWFVGVGDWLSSLDATVGMTFADGSSSTKFDSKVLLTYQCQQRSGGQSSRSSSTEYYTAAKVEDTVQRVKLFSFPSVSYPAFKNPISVKHLITSLALLKKAL